MVGSGTASAQVYAESPGPGGGLVENPDGTWSLWGESPHPRPLKTYTAAEKDRLLRMNSEMEVDGGTTGQDGISVEGSGKVEDSWAKSMDKQLETHELYKTPGEQAVGDDLVEEAEADGTLPAEDGVLGALGTGALEVGGSALVGVAIGTGIDELLGLPSFVGEAPEFIEPGCKYPETTECSEEWRWLPEVRLGPLNTCKAWSEYFGLGAVGSGKCWGASMRNVHVETYTYRSKVEANETTSIYGQTWSGEDIAPCPKATYKLVGCIGTKSEYHLVAPSAGVVLKAFPASGEKALNEHVTGTPTELAPMSPVTTPIKPRPATTTPTKVEEDIAHERENDELPGVEREKGEEPKKVPSPLLPEILPVEHGEVFTHYRDRLEAEGLTHIEANELPDADTDSATGPEGVVSVTPAEGSRVDPETDVRVDVNPKDAPAAVEPVGGFVPPSAPGLHTPDFAVLCSRFPFGIPCWIVGTVGKWTASASPPRFEIPIYGHKIVVDLKGWEPAMEIIRPVFFSAVVLSIIFMFVNWAFSARVAPGEQTEMDVD
jgi:hypothetical protein